MLKKVIALSFSIFTSIIISNAVLGQNSEFKIEVSNDTVLEGNYFIVKYTLKNIDGNFVAPDFEDFDVVGGPMSSSMFSMVNGKSTSESSYKYFLKPKHRGKSKIEPASINSDKQVYEVPVTEIITIANPENIKIEPKLDDEDSSILDIRIDGMENFDYPAKKEKNNKKIELKKI